MTRKGSLVIPFDDFSGGDFGLLDPQKAERNQWQGLNVVLYPSGMIGPRYGLKENVATAGLGSGDVLGLGIGPVANLSGGTSRHFWVVGDDVLRAMEPNYLGGLGDGIDTYTAYGETTVRVSFAYDMNVASEENGFLYAAGLFGSAIRKHTPPSTTASIATPSGTRPTMLTRWNERLVFMDGAFYSQNRIYYSGSDEVISDKETWGVNSYYDIGDASPITALVAMGSALYIGKPTGWWVITGSLGTTATVRQVASGAGPSVIATSKPMVSAVLHSESLIAYVAVGGHPATFNGSSITTYPHQRVPAVTDMGTERLVGFTGVVPLKRGWSMFVGSSSKQGLVFRGGAFFPVAFEMDDDLAWSTTPWDYVYHTDGLRTVSPLSDTTVCASPVDGSGPIRLFTWRYDSDSASTDGTDPAYTSLGDWSPSPVNNHLYLAEYRNPRGVQMRVRAVKVEYDRFTGGLLDGNGFELRVRTLELDDPAGTNTTGYSDSSVFTVSAPEPDEDSGGWIKRFQFDAPIGEGFQIRFTNIFGVAIRRVLVIVDEQDDDGV